MCGVKIVLFEFSKNFKFSSSFFISSNEFFSNSKTSKHAPIIFSSFIALTNSLVFTHFPLDVFIK